MTAVVPNIAQINPNSVQKSTTGNVLTITGDNFLSGIQASWQGDGGFLPPTLTITDTQWGNSTQVQIIVDCSWGLGAPTYQIILTNPGGGSDQIDLLITN